jgi:hypothetical protein
MKQTILIIICTLAISQVFAAKSTLVYTCNGYSKEELTSPDITLYILENNGQFLTEIKFPDREKLSIALERKKLKDGEVSFYDTFINSKEAVQVEVFGDDMGSMSSLEFKGQKYDLTCGG